jgi:hypothetical protein
MHYLDKHSNTNYQYGYIPDYFGVIHYEVRKNINIDRRIYGFGGPMFNFLAGKRKVNFNVSYRGTLGFYSHNNSADVVIYYDGIENVNDNIDSKIKEIQIHKCIRHRRFLVILVIKQR